MYFRLIKIAGGESTKSLIGVSELMIAGLLLFSMFCALFFKKRLRMSKWFFLRKQRWHWKLLGVKDKKCFFKNIWAFSWEMKLLVTREFIESLNIFRYIAFSKLPNQPANQSIIKSSKSSLNFAYTNSVPLHFNIVRASREILSETL